MNKVKLFFLAIILVLAGVLRFYNLDKVPASLNWDEVAAGYNAYTIANWGADEYGIKFPLVFKNFGDDKHPVHIYITAAIVKIFGLSDFTTRSGSALIGVLAVLMIFFLASKIFDSELAGLTSAFFLAVSPYAIHYSRGLWEANFALFFMIAGVFFFYLGLKKKNWLIPLSFIFFELSFFSYHSAKIVVPPVVLLISLIHLKDLIINKKILIWSFVIVLLFGVLVIMEPKILGLARVNQTKFSEDVTKKYGGELQTVFHNYKSYFTYSYLFQTGDQNPRGSVKVIGEFYKIDLIFILLGLLFLILRKKWEPLLLIIFWLALSPIPGAISSIEPNSTRGVFMIVPIVLLSAYGASSFIMLFKKRRTQVCVGMLTIAFLGFEVTKYIRYYFTEYSVKSAIEWQYGMKDLVLFIQKHPEFNYVYVDKMRQQPYIFFLYYLKVPLPTFLKSVKYDNTQSSSFNTVSSFGRYNFGNWDPIESYPSPDIVYVITPSYYTGLRYFNSFTVRKLVKYPNGLDAFYIVSGNEK
jgi:4-amino-4-deoxy-L-arabinose transferase-like glycosyltransferase